MSDKASYYVVHDSNGLQMLSNIPNIGTDPGNLKFEGKVKCFVTSNDGSKVAWISDGGVHVVETSNWNKIGTLMQPKGQEICFSPKGNYLAVWNTLEKVESSYPPNLSIYDVEAKKAIGRFVQPSQILWQPQWTNDESIFSRQTTSEVHFYDSKSLESYKHKKILPKLKSFSLSPEAVADKIHVAFFVPGKAQKSEPAFVKLFQYPEFAGLPVANKSFFKVESVEYFWNAQSTAVLLLTTAEMDKMGTSYYGDQMLFYLSVKGDSTRVTFSTQGNIRSVCWCPNGKEFFAVYGAIPAKATMFNHKCDPVHEFGAGARNHVMVNPVGNVTMIGGMGNISSRIEMWDTANQKQLGEQECPDITHMQWSPCGQYLLTSTCSPRLRVNNGYKVWHHTGALLYEHQLTSATELFAASWLPNPALAKPFTLSLKPVKGIVSQIKTASKERYIPPSKRAAVASMGGTLDTSKKFLSQIDDLTGAKTPKPTKLSRSQKKEAAKAKREAEAAQNKITAIWDEESVTKKGKKTEKSKECEDKGVTETKKDKNKGKRAGECNDGEHKAVTETKKGKNKGNKTEGSNAEENKNKNSDLKNKGRNKDESIGNKIENKGSKIENKGSKKENKKNNVDNNRTSQPQDEEMGDAGHSMKFIKKKLSEIEKLKAQQAAGSTLDKQQQKKLALEDIFLEELKQMKL